MIVDCSKQTMHVIKARPGTHVVEVHNRGDPTFRSPRSTNNFRCRWDSGQGCNAQNVCATHSVCPLHVLPPCFDKSIPSSSSSTVIRKRFNLFNDENITHEQALTQITWIDAAANAAKIASLHPKNAPQLSLYEYEGTANNPAAITPQ